LDEHLKVYWIYDSHKLNSFLKMRGTGKELEVMSPCETFKEKKGVGFV